jgi:hypothetical protein
LVETREIDFETVQEALNEQGAVSSDLSHQPIAEVRDQI